MTTTTRLVFNMAATPTAGGAAPLRAGAAVGAQLDFFSSAFDSALALATPGLQPPRPHVAPLNNLSECRRLLPNDDPHAAHAVPDRRRASATTAVPVAEVPPAPMPVPAPMPLAAVPDRRRASATTAVPVAEVPPAPMHVPVPMPLAAVPDRRRASATTAVPTAEVPPAPMPVPAPMPLAAVPDRRRASATTAVPTAEVPPAPMPAPVPMPLAATEEDEDEARIRAMRERVQASKVDVAALGVAGYLAYIAGAVSSPHTYTYIHTHTHMQTGTHPLTNVLKA
jgi:hypothetical protein